MNGTLVIPSIHQARQTGALVKVHVLNKEAEFFYPFISSLVQDYDPFRKASSNRNKLGYSMTQKIPRLYLAHKETCKKIDTSLNAELYSPSSDVFFPFFK